MFITKKSIIGIVKLAGIISSENRLGSRGGLNLNDLSDSITKAFSFKNIKAIVLLVNSPGGSPVQSALIANRIRDLAKEKEIPVYCFIEDLAASGGYWLSCAADKIYAMESSIIGSIGVITSGFGKIAQVKRMETNTASSHTNPFSDTSVTLNITPSTTTSKISGIASTSIGAGSDIWTFTRVRNSTSSTVVSDYIRYSPRSNCNIISHGTHIFLDSPASTSEQTYVVQAQNNGSSGTAYFNARDALNSDVSYSSIILFEVLD